ncbi:hypothetical protein C5167_033219 [Papaver somniferum]|uniref:Uncharacterized protein n=1 Tax=Papaver somniferum TaxID=3469 RepID=A0A4Y7KBA2_PAPSO|nr:hypothetical protein C5167_033219 [Papaver somniferum]
MLMILMLNHQKSNNPLLKKLKGLMKVVIFLIGNGFLTFLCCNGGDGVAGGVVVVICVGEDEACNCGEGGVLFASFSRAGGSLELFDQLLAGAPFWVCR